MVKEDIEVRCSIIDFHVNILYPQHIYLLQTMIVEAAVVNEEIEIVEEVGLSKFRNSLQKIVPRKD